MSRTALIPVRVSDGEKTLIREKASACGLEVSEYMRSRALGTEPQRRSPQRSRGTAKSPLRQPTGHRSAEDFDTALARIKREQPGLPDRNARILASRQTAR